MTVNQCPCGHHELHTTLEIGGWAHGPDGSSTVRKWAARPDLWDKQNRELSREELQQRIEQSGGISCEHAVEAETLPTGAVRLIHGVHRWATAAKLGIITIPVSMRHPEHESPVAW